jgi:hypothetical protein
MIIRDRNKMIMVFVLGLVLGVIAGYQSVICKPCDEFNVKIKTNEKIINKNTPVDSVLLEWKRRNGSKG